MTGTHSITLNNVNINTGKEFDWGDYGIKIASGNTILTLLGTNTIDIPSCVGGSAMPIWVAEGTTLTINGDGILNAYNGSDGKACIGAYWDGKCGTININSGTINARGGGNGGAVIGESGKLRGYGTINITGGVVTCELLNGGGNPTGLGGSIVSITGGIVSATVPNSATKSDCILNDTVYGNFTLDSDLTVESDETLTVPAGSSLTVASNVTLTVEGSLVNNGTVTNNGTVVGKTGISNNCEWSGGEALAPGNGSIVISEGNVVITETGYTVGDEAYAYTGDITINGNSTATGNVITVNADREITLNNVIIGRGDEKPANGTPALTIAEDTEAILNIVGNVYLGDNWNYNGTYVVLGNKAALTIRGDGTLYCKENSGSPKISLGTNASVTVESGTVILRTSDGGYPVDGNGTFTVNGGHVKLRSDYDPDPEWGAHGKIFGDSVEVFLLGGTMEVYHEDNDKTAQFNSESLSITGGTLKSSLSNFNLDKAFTLNGGMIEIASEISNEVKTASTLTEGIIFEGDSGTVYGEVELDSDLAIESSKTLTISESSTLIIGSGVTLTVEGSLVNNGTVTNNGTVFADTEITGTGTWGNHPAVVKYTVTVTNGTGSGSYAENATVTITADDPDDGKQFKEWTTEDGVAFANANSETTTFVMPAKNVTVTATYEDIPVVPPTTYTVSFNANDGTGEMAPATVEAGTSYQLPASTFTAPADKVFDKWALNDADSLNYYEEGDVYTVNADTVFYAIWEDASQEPAPTTYTVTVTNGGTGTSGSGTYAEGDTVTISAGTKSNYRFSGWTSTDGIVFANASSATTTFTMLGKEVTVTANWTYLGGGGGSSSSSSSGSTTTTTKNPDGSITSTVTNKNTGVVTETTKMPDGTTGTIVTDKNGTVTKVTGSVSNKAVKDAAKTGEAVTLPVEVPASTNSKDAPAVEVTLPKNSGTVKVEIPVEKVTPGTVAIILNADGTEKIVTTSIPTENGVVLTVDGSTAIKIVDNAKVFSDVPANSYFNDAVAFASARGITGGTSATTFSPDASCTRAQIVTYLWRAAGSPVVTYDMDFSDVSADAYYADAVRWAVSMGVTTGTGNGTFSPDATCTRAQAMTFIYRNEQAQGGGMQGAWMIQNPFADVNLENYYGEAVMWAVINSVTNGTGATTFSPNANCTRAQIVTFLYNYLVE